MAQPSPTMLAAQMSALIDSWRIYIDQQKEWLAGTPTGGPNGDGLYPLSDAHGATVLVPCPAKQAATVSGTVGSAEDFADSAQADALTAGVARVASEAARDVALTHRNDAQAARDLAGSYSDTAGSSAANALVYKNQAQAAAVTTTADAALAAVSADQAEEDRIDAQAARVAAEAAAAAAQTWNPTNYDTKTQVDAKISALVDAAPGALNTLNELAAALGDDPNFATTMTTQLGLKLNTSAFTWSGLAGKPTTFAPSSHTHVWADITSRPTTLAGYGITDSFGSAGGDVSGTTRFTNGNVRVQGHSGTAGNGVVYFGDGDEYIWKNGSTFFFRVAGQQITLSGAAGSIYHSGNFNPASKLDARGSLGAIATQTFTDWNDADENGWWMSSTAANAPGTGWWMGRVTHHTGSWIQQEAEQFTTAQPRPVYRRSKNNGTWSAWTTDISQGNASLGPGPNSAGNSLRLGDYAGASGWAGIYNAALTPSGSNYALIQKIGGDFTYVNATSEVGLRISNTSILTATATQLAYKNANSTTLTRIPRVFVGGADPGAAAADGDIWIP